MLRPKLHLICNAHLDPVWQWRWEEGCAEALATFRVAAQLLAEKPDWIFNHNEALLYQWVQKYDPPLFRQIQHWVNQGRWFISGGWYLQPDVNLPVIESIIRHIAEGRQFFHKNFQVRPEVAYNFDSFGHSAGLPQILVQSGYKMYIHMRPSANELELPGDLYRWRGADGSEIIGYRISVGLYHTEYDNIEQRLAEGVELALSLNRDVPVFWGIGNHGGGATRADLEKITAFGARESRVEVIHSTPDRFYHAIKDLSPGLPIVEGDLQRIFTGCYTSLARLKRRALKSSAQLLQAETLRAITWWLYDQDYPVQELHSAWQDHLFNDFHDILPGSCVEPAEQDALDLYGKISESVRRLSLGAAVAFNQKLATSADLPLTVLNTVPGFQQIPVEFECMVSHRPKWSGLWHLRLFGCNGTEIACQEEQTEALLPFNGWRRKLCFMASLPDLGAAHYYLDLLEGAPDTSARPAAVNFRFGPSGLVESLVTNSGQELLAGPLLLPMVMQDDADSWGSERWEYRELIDVFRSDQPEPQVIASGPVRTIYETVLHYHHSQVILHTIAYSDWPVLEFRARIHWHEKQKRLKFSIPTLFKTGQLRCEVPGAITTRTADGQEHVMGRWLMLSPGRTETAPALGLAHNGQHGVDFKTGEARISVLRSAAYCHEQGFKITERPHRKYMDQGTHEIRFYIAVEETYKLHKMLSGLADLLNAPPLTFAHLPFGGAEWNEPESVLGTEMKTWATITPQNIRLLACKRSWDDHALILRLQECSGAPTPTKVHLHQPEITIFHQFQPLEIATIRLERSGKWSFANLIDEQA